MTMTKKPVLLVLISMAGLLAVFSIMIWFSLRPVHPQTMSVIMTFLWIFIGPSLLVAALVDRLLGHDHFPEGGSKG